MREKNREERIISVLLFRIQHHFQGPVAMVLWAPQQQGTQAWLSCPPPFCFSKRINGCTALLGTFGLPAAQLWMWSLAPTTCQ